MSRARSNILKWLPPETEENKSVFVECNQLQLNTEKLVYHLGDYFTDLKNRQRKGEQLSCMHIPFDIDGLESILVKTTSIVKTYKKVYPKLSASTRKLTQIHMELKKDMLWKAKLKISYLLQKLINKIAHFFVNYGRRVLEITLLLSNLYNQLMDLDNDMDKDFSRICSNTCPYYLHPMKKMTITKLLQLIADNRAESCSHQLIDCLLNTYKSQNIHLDEDTSSNSSFEIYKALTKHMTPSHDEQSPSPVYPENLSKVEKESCSNTSVNLTRPKSSVKFENLNDKPTIAALIKPNILPKENSFMVTNKENLEKEIKPKQSTEKGILKKEPATKNDLYIPGGETIPEVVKNPVCSDVSTETSESTFASMEDIIESENNNVILLLSVTLETMPELLGNDGIKKSKNGEMKISSKAKDKVLDFFEKILWTEAGNFLEHIILWWGASPLCEKLPQASQHLREWIMQFIPTAEVPGFIVAALQTLGDALGVYVTLTSWDQNFRLALVASSKPNNPNTGQLFSNMLGDLVSLSNQCEVTSEWTSGAPLEDLPLVEQIPILHRLDHSIHTTRMWGQTETKRLANNWNVDSFFKVTHIDITNCLTQLNNLRLADHTEAIAKGGLQEHTNVCANMRAKLVSEVQENFQKLKKLPEECIQCLATVCRTISLANLQMVFPDAKYWRQERSNVPEMASSYVATFLDTVLTPVLAATNNEQISNMVLKIMCEAWLDHIYMNKIKFTKYGARQLLKDFASVADWLNNCHIISEENRKKMIKNEVLRRCEGVGRLLLRSPGEPIKMTDNTKTVTENNEESAEQENSQLMPAEMYVPNQEQWLELRASKKKSIFNPICC